MIAMRPQTEHDTEPQHSSPQQGLTHSAMPYFNITKCTTMPCRAPKAKAPNDALQMAWKKKMAGKGKPGEKHAVKNAKRKGRGARALAKPVMPRKARSQRTQSTK